ncbi:MAG: HAMP domain-containing histidine kinase [Lachnospiraceae bacterium]|nr:HAMP domain-containing histidine kinase [Lachnospiraceae bacterium]
MKSRLKTTGIGTFLVFFMLMGFVVTCNFLLFLQFVDLSTARLYKAAPATLINVLFLTVLFCVFDSFRRYKTVQKPVGKIKEGLSRVMTGDFSTKIEYLYGEDSGNEFDEIIGGINTMIGELSGVETLRTDFISNVSHELKTPLAVMQNYGILLQNPDLSEEERMQYGKAITEQTQRLSALVTNILKLNKLENQQIYPCRESIYLGESVCECMLDFERVWEEKEISIETDINDDVKIMGDKELLSLVWYNLISNALKFTSPGGEVALSVYEEGEYACVSVKDSGCGMNEETGKNIFKKFYQGDTSHATQGNGLGLALVKRVIDICGGEISVSSREGEGSIFTVKLARERKEEDGKQ